MIVKVTCGLADIFNMAASMTHSESIQRVVQIALQLRGERSNELATESQIVEVVACGVVLQEALRMTKSQARSYIKSFNSHVGRKLAA